MNFNNLILVIFGVWLIVLSGICFFWLLFFRKLSRGIKEKDLRKILDKILEKQVENSDLIVKINREIEKIKDASFGHVQKLGLIKFNPFKEIGGDHSFSLALLDGRDNGLIITALHTRERTRIYAKPVKTGKSELELSDEEKRALIRAQRM